MSDQKYRTNDMIGILTERITEIEREETALLELNNVLDRPLDAEQRAALEAQIGKCIHLVLENLPLLENVLEAKEAGQLRNLDPRPYKIAVYRLKAAVLQGHATCGKLAIKSN